MVGDVNTNRLVSGTTIAVTASKGTLTGQTSYTVPDGVPYGPTQIYFTLSDADSDTTVDLSTITVTVSSTEVVTCSSVIAPGTVQ
jgi:hypothetical protein